MIAANSCNHLYSEKFVPALFSTKKVQGQKHNDFIQDPVVPMLFPTEKGQRHFNFKIIFYTSKLKIIIPIRINIYTRISKKSKEPSGRG
jgi:hypothetical protein